MAGLARERARNRIVALNTSPRAVLSHGLDNGRAATI